ncbi:hypothetical protein BX600DRAFT_463362 [Xylariales sp. PMI_506]|nr:hypothetical protein BX600DRAFT_463362 [Xylariales sp. PMI_506]
MLFLSPHTLQHALFSHLPPLAALPHLLGCYGKPVNVSTVPCPWCFLGKWEIAVENQVVSLQSCIPLCLLRRVIPARETVEE